MEYVVVEAGAIGGTVGARLVRDALSAGDDALVLPVAAALEEVAE